MSTPTLTSERLALEWQALNQVLPPNAFAFRDLGTDNPYVLMGARTNSGNLYTMRVELKDFPAKAPDVIIDKLLLTKDGEPLQRATMHARNDEQGRTHICHSNEDYWYHNISLMKVFIKCRLWLEMYELHLHTGENIDYYLSHQD